MKRMSQSTMSDDLKHFNLLLKIEIFRSKVIMIFLGVFDDTKGSRLREKYQNLFIIYT